MNKRNDTRREVLLDVRDEPIMSIDALVEQCHRALSAQLWMTCCWSEKRLGLEDRRLQLCHRFRRTR
jgi:hypothetical protein